jgi:HPt (histidine-containing phosphotransfer) domain-containing protein
VGDEDDLDAIWAEHRPATARRLATLRRVAAAAERGELDEELRQAGVAEAHTLAGAASIFGFPDGTRVAREIERRLRDPSADGGGGEGLVRLAEALARELDRDRDARGPAG